MQKKLVYIEERAEFVASKKTGRGGTKTKPTDKGMLGHQFVARRPMGTKGNQPSLLLRERAV